jgi:hypothetical protein
VSGYGLVDRAIKVRSPAEKKEEIYLLHILDLGARCGEWSASRPGRALPPRKSPRYPLDRTLGGPGMDAEARGKILYFYRGSNPSRSVRSQRLYRLSYPLPLPGIHCHYTLSFFPKFISLRIELNLSHTAHSSLSNGRHRRHSTQK